MTTTPTPTSSISTPKHPAKFSDSILATVRPFIQKEWTVLDPFAGTGRVHEIEADTWGVEIEPEWATLHPRTIVGDALHLPFRDHSFDCVFTSPTYGNRMADHHEARDDSRRLTYRHQLGRALHPNNSGQLQWGPRYREFHEQAWYEVWRVLKPGGTFILNVSDHIRGGERVPVVEWHKRWLRTMTDLAYEGTVHVATPRMKFGQNHDVRVDSEAVLLFRRRPLRHPNGRDTITSAEPPPAPAGAQPTGDALMSDTSVVDDASTEAPEVADGTDAAGTEADEQDEQKSRRPRGWLEHDVKSICDKFVTGEVTLGEGEYLTPHRIARLVQKLDSLDSPPSTGAVAAVLNRWVELGFVQTNDKPFAFVDYSEEGRNEGLSALKERRSAARKQARADAKASAAPAAEGDPNT